MQNTSFFDLERPLKVTKCEFRDCIRPIFNKIGKLSGKQFVNIYRTMSSTKTMFILYILFVQQIMADFNFTSLRLRIHAKVTKDSFNKGCWKWNGCQTAGGRYGKMTVTIQGVAKSMGAHRASYMAYEECIDLPDDVSHCCHEGLCVNPDHLSHEHHLINSEREICRRKGQCTLHTGYKPCIFEKKVSLSHLAFTHTL